jgi:branched-chain amino acid transport system ATP-binding protein
MLLNLSEIFIHYQKVAAVKGLSIELEEGQLVTLIGSNGAGKSTTLRAISGLVRPSAGEIWFDGQRVDGFSPDKILKLGIAHVPEGRRVFRVAVNSKCLPSGAR